MSDQQIADWLLSTLRMFNAMSASATATVLSRYFSRLSTMSDETLKLLREIREQINLLGSGPLDSYNSRTILHGLHCLIRKLDVHLANPPASVVEPWVPLIRDELAKARTKFPTWQRDTVTPAAVVCEEAGELIRAALQRDYENGSMEACNKEAIQTAAMCVRFLERK